MRLRNLKDALLAGASAAVLMTAAPALADQTYSATQTKNTTAGGNLAESGDSTNSNVNAGNTFKSFTGVASEVQNNGANASINNGNAVSAGIGTDLATGVVNYTVQSGQTATQVGGSSVSETTVDSDNLIEDQSFQNANGVFSKVQNNGAESAINNGNAVAAAILEGATDGATLESDSTQTASVNGGNNNYQASSSIYDNDIRDDAFGGTQGVVSALQNNGPNSALNNGNAVSAVIAPGGDVTGPGILKYDDGSTAGATVSGSNFSSESNSSDVNRIRTRAFQSAQGIASALQNNGANTAANNGNAVSAIVSDNLVGSSPNFTMLAKASQTAGVTGAGGSNTSNELGSHDTNLITGNAFETAQGVFSAMQNNGANAALNGGNSVSAVITAAKLDKPNQLTAESTQLASVLASVTNTSNQQSSDDSNTIDGSAFNAPQGVLSATQNNGANTAGNNGNTVAASISGSSDVDNSQTLTTNSRQSAVVRSNGTNDSIEQSSLDSNLVSGAAFASMQGVASVLQNNGANSALNNGNTAAAVIAGPTGTTADDFLTDSTQTARVDSDALSGNISNEFASDNNNSLTANSFQNAGGVSSVLQNNGANSAINNGNTVSAFIAIGGSSAGAPNQLQAPDTGMTVVQSATVEANASNSGDPDGNQNLEGGTDNRVVETNLMTGNTFQNGKGVFSAMQNNGANSAINNGNTVSAAISDALTGATFQSPAKFDTVSTQTALVTNNDGAGGNGGANISRESRDGTDGNPDTNTINSNAFGATKGVMSVGQNNGSNAAINNGNTVAAIISDKQANTTDEDELTATSVQTATVQSLFGNEPDGNFSEEANSTDTNTIAGGAFNAAQGVGSVLQNNGANSALNNGNTVSAIISDGQIASRADFSADSRQDARVSARDNTLNRDQQGNVSGSGGAHPSDESNRITSTAFFEAEGVFSALQNNGPNSAANNGNTVAAFISDAANPSVALDGDSALDANQDPDFTSRQTARVEGGANGGTNESRQQGSDDRNRIDVNAFQAAEGVFSVLQNNGGNSALNNGNTVAAVIAENGIGTQQNATFETGQVQTAVVDAVGGRNVSLAATLDLGTEPSLASNQLTGTVFSNAEGVFSVLQNNGANSAVNNGNAVTAFIVTNGTADIGTNNTFNADGTQTARVDAVGGENFNFEADSSHDTNTINGDALFGTQGVVSVTQNNGANTAINNGNTVAAVFNGSQAAGTFTVTDTSSATVAAGSASSTEFGVTNTNTMGGNAFQSASGVVSVVQNNGANAAINNGNTVAAFIN